MARALLVGLRILATPPLVLLLVASFFAWTAASVARGSLLAPGFYLGALEENRVYDRVYTELLRDPKSQEKVTDLLGGTRDVPTQDAERLLRQVLPPEYLQHQLEQNVRTLLAYLQRDADELTMRVELRPVLDNIRPVAVEYAATRLQSVERHRVESYPAYATRLVEVVDGLKRGDIPANVPAFELSEKERAAAAGTILGDGPVSEDERAAVAQALTGADTVGALGAALVLLLRQRTEESLLDLRQALGSGDVLDLVGQAASDQNTTKEEMLSGLDPAREVASAAHSWGIPVTVGATALATALLGLLYLPSRARAFAVAGSVLLRVGLLGVAGWYVQREIAPGRVHEAVLNADSEAPESERLIAADVARSLMSDTSLSAWPPVLAFLVTAGTFIGLAFAFRTGPKAVGQETVVP